MSSIGNDKQKSLPPWIAYVLPMALFMLFTALLETAIPRQFYPWAYMAKVLVVTWALVALRGPLKDVKPNIGAVPLAVAVGMAVFAIWIYGDNLYPHFGSRTGYNPFSEIQSGGSRLLFLAVRFYGLAIMVPVMEEVFWRSFLLRYITSPDFTALKIGDYSWSAFAIVAVAFGAAHPEWLSAVVCACAYALLLRRSRSLFACVVAHGTTNLALGIYVLDAGAWKFW